MINMYRFLANFYPKNIRKNYRTLLMYSHVKINAERFMGFMLFSGVGLSLASTFFIAGFVNIPFWLLLPILFLIIEFLVYLTLVLRADKKARFVENILPDALQLMASNLRAGFTMDRALLLSARPEFGPLADEINQVGKEITLGKDIADSLLNMADRIKSERLKKTMMLVVSGLKSGGQLASLLEQTSRNLRQQTFVDERIRANVMMYVIFVFAAVGIGSPVLFGLSSFLIEVLSENLASVQLPDAATMSSMPLSFTQISISLSFIIQFTLIALVVNSILGSLILGLISKGKEKLGISYIPILVGLSVGMFFAVRFVIKNMLGSLFGI